MSLESKLFPAPPAPARRERPWAKRRQQQTMRLGQEGEAGAAPGELEKAGNSKLERFFPLTGEFPAADPGSFPGPGRELAKESSPGGPGLVKAESQNPQKVPVSPEKARKSPACRGDLSGGGDQKRLLPECPFYHRDDGQRRIWCEGITAGGVVVLHCASSGAFRIQWQTFCAGRYQNCELYRAAMEKYEE